MFFGGLTMLIVAVLEVFRRNSLGATAFGTFGEHPARTVRSSRPRPLGSQCIRRSGPPCT